MKSLNQITRMLILSLLSLTFMFSACKKDTETSSKTDRLTLGLWKMTAYTMDNPNPGSPADIFAILDDCTKDDTHKFNADKTMIIDDGMLKCESSNPQTNTGTWSFNSDETILMFPEYGKTHRFTLLKLTDKILKLKYTENETYTITFSH